MGYTSEKAHISTIKNGDTIIHNGAIFTVCDDDIKRGFFGITLRGDSYSMGTKPVLIVRYLKCHGVSKPK